MRVAIIENGDIVTVVEAESVKEVEQFLTEGQTARKAAIEENADDGE